MSNAVAPSRGQQRYYNTVEMNDRICTFVFNLYLGNEKAKKSKTHNLDSARGALLNKTIPVLLSDWGRELCLLKCISLWAYISGMHGPNRAILESKLDEDGAFPTSYRTRIQVVQVGSYSRYKSWVSRISDRRGGAPEPRGRLISIKSPERISPSKFECSATFRF